MAERLTAKVAEILTGQELVLSKGSDDGVQVGMRFAVLNRKGAEIKDPDSGEVLGSVELEKTLVKVVRLHRRLSVARTFRQVRSGGGVFGMGTQLAQIFDTPRRDNESLLTDERKLREELDERDSYVKIGDLAVQVVGDEFSSGAA